MKIQNHNPIYKILAGIFFILLFLAVLASGILSIIKFIQKAYLISIDTDTSFIQAFTSNFTSSLYPIVKGSLEYIFILFVISCFLVMYFLSFSKKINPDIDNIKSIEFLDNAIKFYYKDESLNRKYEYEKFDSINSFIFTNAPKHNMFVTSEIKSISTIFSVDGTERHIEFSIDNNMERFFALIEYFNKSKNAQFFYLGSGNCECAEEIVNCFIKHGVKKHYSALTRRMGKFKLFLAYTFLAIAIGVLESTNKLSNSYHVAMPAIAIGAAIFFFLDLKIILEEKNLKNYPEIMREEKEVFQKEKERHESLMNTAIDISFTNIPATVLFTIKLAIAAIVSTVFIW